jgi:branched-chain amino acid transport system ATP-binding protein
MTTPAVLEVEGVTVRYGGVTALDGVDIAVGAGEIVGVIGPNGAGKTTLFDVISGARRPSGGQVHLGGDDVTRRSPAWRARRGVRRTFQRQQVFGALSVEENLLVALEDRATRGGVAVDLLGLSARRRSVGSNDERVEAMIEACGLEQVRRAPAGALPIGVARIVELARALIGEPQLLLLDEPTSGLGENETAAFSTVLRAHLDESASACGVLLVEHDVGFVMDHADRLVVLDLGRVIADGDPAEVRTNPDVQRAYLG